jgi:hypothetical protein
MIAKVESASLIKELTFWDVNSSPLSLQDVSLRYLKQEAKVIECRLNFAVSLEGYETISRKNLFNLQPEIKGSTSGGNFLPQYKIQLEVSLKPDLLATLLANGDGQEDGIDYLVSLNEELLHNISQNDNEEVTEAEKNIKCSINPLLNTESWLCLSVKQIQDTGEVGFNTFWNYVNFSHLDSDDTKEEEIAEGVFNFVKDYAESNLLEMAENATKDIISSVNNAFEEILKESSSELEIDFGSSDSIFEEVVDFLESEGWSFVKGKDRSSLRLQHRGKNGQWKCIAIAREEEQEFIFYSICPLTASENKKLAVAELITRINYGLTVGNFELDFITGTIRYKTSINVAGDYLSYAIIGNLVKGNVAVMDKYLPEILAVIDEE